MNKYFLTMTLKWTGEIEASNPVQAEALAIEKFAEELDEQEFEIKILDWIKLPDAAKGETNFPMV